MQSLNSLVTSSSGHEAAVKMLVLCGKILRERVCNMAVEQFVVNLHRGVHADHSAPAT